MENQPSESLFEEKETHFNDYLILILKRKWLILLCLLISFFITWFYVNSYEPIYQATTKLILDKSRAASPITGEGIDVGGFRYETLDLNTHFTLMTSSPVMEMVVNALDLDSEKKDKKNLEISQFREIVKQFKTNIKLLLKQENKKGFTKAPVLLSEEEIEQARERKRESLAGMIKNKVSIEQLKGTRLFTVSIRDKDPQRAADICNALAKKYTEFDRASRVNSSQETLEWLNNEMYTLRKKLEDAEQKFFEYKQQNKIFSLEGKQGMANQKIIDFNNKYLETRNRRVELDAKINELTKSISGETGIANVRSLINNPTIELSYAKIIDLELELARLKRTFKSKHPKIIQVESGLAESRSRLVLEVKKELNSVKAEREMLLAREKVLETTIGEFESDALKASSKELRYTILQRNVNTSQNLYELMVSRIKESDILKNIEMSNIRIVEKASVPGGPISNNKKRQLYMSLALGLGIGIGLAFFLEYLDRSIRTEEDIQQYFNLTVLSVIPLADRSETYGANK